MLCLNGIKQIFKKSTSWEFKPGLRQGKDKVFLIGVAVFKAHSLKFENAHPHFFSIYIEKKTEKTNILIIGIQGTQFYIFKNFKRRTEIPLQELVRRNYLFFRNETDSVN